MKILFVVTEDWYFCSHRLPLAKAMRDAGFQVSVATRVKRFGGVISAEGFKLIPIALKRRGRNPFMEIWAILELAKIYRNESPDIVHHVAIKPILYGSLAAKLASVPVVVNAFTGLGLVFTSRNLKFKIMRWTLLNAFRVMFAAGNVRLIFQNTDDMNIFSRLGVIELKKASLIRGSGVDMAVYVPSAEAAGLPLVVLASRMIWSKGVGEFVQAAELLKQRNVKARFALVGDTDSGNPSAIPRAQLRAWASSGVIEWWGRDVNMPAVFSRAHIVCLPSFYGEGVPKVLIEAAAAGRPIVTTDTPGCREIVKHTENGFLVPPRNSEALADALESLIGNPILRQEMGVRGRHIALSKFSIEKVVRETFLLYREALAENGVRV